MIAVVGKITKPIFENTGWISEGRNITSRGKCSVINNGIDQKVMIVIIEDMTI